jgi:hypothetical protein
LRGNVSDNLILAGQAPLQFDKEDPGADLIGKHVGEHFYREAMT